MAVVFCSHAQFVYAMLPNGGMKWVDIDTFLLSHPNGGATLCISGGFSTNPDVGRPIATVTGQKIQTWAPIGGAIQTAQTLSYVTGTSTTTHLRATAMPDIYRYYRCQYRLYNQSPITWFYVNSNSRDIFITGQVPATVYEARVRVVGINAALLNTLGAAFRWTTQP